MLGLACVRLPIVRSTTAAISYRLHSFCASASAISVHGSCSHTCHGNTASGNGRASIVNGKLTANGNFFNFSGGRGISGVVAVRNEPFLQHRHSQQQSRHASIWHALLPSASSSAIVSRRRRRSVVCGACEGDGSWNATWDARPARWLHGSRSAWLLFGVCACFSASASASNPDFASADAELPLSLSYAATDADSQPPLSSEKSTTSPHRRQVFTDYTITSIPADGRCLFRAVVHGASLRTGKPSPSENVQRQLADELRVKVADEFVTRREETEWFLEGSFDAYVEHIRKPHVWGGEPELLMASHVLKMPITVYMHDRDADGLRAIAEYGQEYGKGNPISLLYDGCGHYEALEVRH